MTPELPEGIAVDVPASGPGCVECTETGGWWFHLRRCAQCGHVGCCDTSPSQHATKHHHASGHPYIQSYEPGENWFYDFRTGDLLNGPQLAPPTSHPQNQPVPGPSGAVPPNWQQLLH